LQNKLARLPGTTEVRKELVGTALSYLDGLSKEASGDLGLQQELAEAYKLIGSIQGGGNQNLGDWHGALISFEKAEGIARQILARTQSREARKLLVRTLCQKAQLYHGAGDESQSERSAKEAVQLARELVRSEPGNEEAQAVLVNALEALAPYSNTQDRLAYLSEASAIAEALLARKTSDRERQRDVALIDKYLAGAYMLTEDNAAGAYPYLKRAGELDEERWRQASNDPVAKLDLAIDLSQWAEYYNGTKDLRSAIEFTRRSLELRREIVAANPKDTWAQDRLSYILGALGSLQLEKSPREALASYKEALAVGGYPDTRAALFAGSGAAYRKLGDNQAACGAYGEAAKLYREILKGSLRQVHLARAAETEQAYAVCSVGKSGVSTR
jgi:tetratricopeptide (TPR) repeat protein